jgi:anti-sigma regulatory factor (Ser/Thr protein kinase)
MIKIFKADTSELKAVIFCMKLWLKTHRVHLNLCEKCHVICEEIFTNIALYAYPKENKDAYESDDFAMGQNDCVCIEFIFIDIETISLTFTDTGIPFNLAAYNSTSDNNISSMGGMGVRIVMQMSYSVIYKRKNNKNILSVKLRKDSD